MSESQVSPTEPLVVRSKREDDTLIVEAVGEIDAHTCERLEAALAGAGMAPGPVVLDLSGVGFIDSSGLRVLVNAHRARETLDHGLVLRGLSPPIQRLFDVTGLTDLFTTAP